MRVLLTRAAADAARTRATLESLGHRVLVSPVIDVVALDAAWPGGVVDAVLATSAQAFAAIAPGWGPTAEARRLMPLWLVGGRTAQAAQACGFLGSTDVAPNAVALAFEMSKRRGQRRIVYLAGRDRKPDVETALRVTDQTVEVVEVYDAKRAEELAPETAAALRQDTLDAVLHYSRRSATIFVDLAKRITVRPGATHVCLSENVATAFAGHDWPVHVAAEPVEAAMVATVQAVQPISRERG